MLFRSRNPGSANHVYFIAAALDYVNNDFYLNVGNYTAPGRGYETTLAGDSITSFNEGISANAIGIEFLTPAGIHSGSASNETIGLAPNPVNNWLNVSFNDLKDINAMKIVDITGRTIYSSALQGNEKSVRINTSSYSPGVYFLSANLGNGAITKKFIKQ